MSTDDTENHIITWTITDNHNDTENYIITRTITDNHG